MEIKKNLKALDVKISKLATDLGISRPTLDTYIEYYERGQQIPNEGYQKIFEYLFSNDEMNSIEFAQKYDYVKRVMLKDAKSGVERNYQSQREEMLSEKVKGMIDSGEIDKSLLEFMNLFASNKDNGLVKAIYNYFNYTNGYIDMKHEEISDNDKALYSQFCKLFEGYQNGNVEYLDDYYQQVLSKNQALFEKKKVNPTQDDIIDYIKSNLNDNDDINVEVLKQMIKSMEEK